MRDSRDYGLAQCSLDDLRGGDAASNAARAKAALEGGDTQAHRDALVLGAALALEVTGRVPDARAGVQRALAAIESGAAARSRREARRVRQGARAHDVPRAHGRREPRARAARARRRERLRSSRAARERTARPPRARARASST